MTTDLEEAELIVPTKEEDDDQAMGPSKPSKIVMKAWCLITRITLIVYLVAFVTAYLAFSHDQMEACFGFCDRMPAEATVSWSQSAAYNKDLPSTIPHPRLLPSFSKGGVIFFLHVPKTGGVSLRKALEKGPGQYLLSDNRQKFDRFKRDIASYLKYGTNHGEVVVMELHASSSPTLMEVSERLHQWRKIASMSKVPFFAFTVLREPVSFSTSFFNFFYGEDHGDPNYHYYESPSEEDFLDTAVFNPQCGFLVKGDVVFTEKKEQQTIVKSDCDVAYETLLDHMDWIGTTNTLSSETFPILRSLIGSNANNADHLIGETAKVRNQSPQKIQKNNLSAQAVQKIQQMSLWDQDMYQKVKGEYAFDQVKMVEEQTE